MDLELRHLRTIRAIADAGSLTKAATVLGLAQLAMSAQLKRIERALGGELFERGRHGVRATALGEFVLARARVVLPAVSGLREEARRFARAWEGGGGFRLGGTHGPLLGALVDRLATAHPGVPVSTHTSWSEREIAALTAAGSLDFALVGTCGASAPPESEVLVWREVGRDPVFVMLPTGHPLAGHQEIELGWLAEEAWTDVPGDGCFASASPRRARAPGSPRAGVRDGCGVLRPSGAGGAGGGLVPGDVPADAGPGDAGARGTPLYWRHVLGWHPAAPAHDTAAAVFEQARAAHAEAAARSESYTAWLAAPPITPGTGVD